MRRCTVAMIAATALRTCNCKGVEYIEDVLGDHEGLTTREKLMLNTSKVRRPDEEIRTPNMQISVKSLY